MRRWFALVVCIVVASAALVAVWWARANGEWPWKSPAGSTDRSTGFAQSNKAEQFTFEPGSLVVLEDASDFPDEPRALHPAKLHVLAPVSASGAGDAPASGPPVATFAAPHSTRARPVVLTQHHLYYFDTEEAALVEATSSTSIEGTQVQDERFGGYALATSSSESTRGNEEKIAYGRTTSHQGEYKLELVLFTRDGQNVGNTEGARFTEQVLWQSTSKAAQVVVPLAWATDGETIFFGARPMEQRLPTFTELLQLRIRSEQELAGEPSTVAFPSDTTELLGLSTDSNLALYRDTAQLELVDLATGRSQVVPSDTSQPITSVAFGEQLAVVTHAVSGQTFLELIQFGVAQTTRIELPGSDMRVIAVEGSSAIVTSTTLGTTKLSLKSSSEPYAKVSQLECVGFASIP